MKRVVEHPWLTIVLFTLVTSILAVRIPELYIEPDVRTMMAGDHPEFVYNDWLEDYFGIRDPAVLMVINDGPDGVFTPETLALVQLLSEAMEELEGIDGEDLVSLSAVDNITGEDDVLEVEPFFEEPPATRQEALAIREAVFDNPMMLGALVSRDGHATIDHRGARGRLRQGRAVPAPPGDRGRGPRWRRARADRRTPGDRGRDGPPGRRRPGADVPAGDPGRGAAAVLVAALAPGSRCCRCSWS